MTDNENAKALECSGMVGPIEILYRDKPWEELVTVGDVVGFLNHLKAENEELKCRNQNLTSDLTSAKAEIDRLQADNVKLHTIIPKMLVEAKYEAIKEFAERLKEKLKMPVGTILGVLVYTDEIYNLVKELSEVSDNA